MLSAFPLQTSTGGSPALVAVTLLGLLVTAAVALAIAYLLLRGYRRQANRARLSLGVGLVLLTTGPIVIQLVLTNFTDVSALGRSMAANASKLLGLGAMLYAIYGSTRTTVSAKVDRDIGPPDWGKR